MVVCVFQPLDSVVADDDTQHNRPTVTIALVGDSTVAEKSGWGPGFARYLKKDATCINLAAGGRSSRSFRSEGRWDRLLELKPDYVLIQFGHNDQPGKGPARESSADSEFRDHLRRYVREAHKNDIFPILLTSLTRRRWNDHGHIDSNLKEYSAATKAVANETQTPLIDLHSLSIQQCNAYGPQGFQIFEPRTKEGIDHTHLNEAGSLAVGQLIAEALPMVVPELDECILTSIDINPARPHPEASTQHSFAN